MNRPNNIQTLKLTSKGEIEIQPSSTFTQQDLDKSLSNLREAYSTSNLIITSTPIKGITKEGVEMDAVIFFSCKREDEREVRRLLPIYADDRRNDHKLSTKIGLGKYIVNYGVTRVCGWHCIDQDFVFFTNLKAFQQYLNLVKQ